MNERHVRINLYAGSGSFNTCGTQHLEPVDLFELDNGATIHGEGGRGGDSGDDECEFAFALHAFSLA